MMTDAFHEGELAVQKKAGVRVCAEDAALSVVAPNEEITKHEVAKRVVAKGIEIGSSNPANALATAMTRSKRFVRTGRGVFKHVPKTTVKLVMSADDEDENDDTLLASEVLQ